MVLSNYKVGAGLAVSDMGRAREFYEGKLGLVAFGLQALTAGVLQRASG